MDLKLEGEKWVEGENGSAGGSLKRTKKNETVKGRGREEGR